MNGDLISRKWLTDAIRNRRTYLSYEDAKDVIDLIDNAPTVNIEDQIAGAYNEGYMCGNKEAEKGRPQCELKEYKPLELDYNVKSAVENLKTAYWSNDTEKYAKAFTEAEEIIINAICHYGYIVCKQSQGELANEVWKLYEKHQSHLATHVIEFGDELKELLGKYQKGGAE